MEFKQVVGSRRSIRLYQPWRPVEPAKIQTILEAARLSSAAVNATFAKAIVVYRDQLSEEERNSLKTPTTSTNLDLAPVWIFWYGDLSAIEKTNQGQTLKQLIDVGALGPWVGFTYKYVDDVIWAQILKPISESGPAGAPFIVGEACLAVCTALLCTVDEGLGTQLTAFNGDAAKKLFDAPDEWIPIFAQLIGYPAESPDGGGQRPRPPLGEQFFEMRYGNPFKRDPEVVKALEAAGMIQPPAPLPWRMEEMRAHMRMFGLPE